MTVKKTLFKSIASVLVLGAIYGTGVYYTGKTVDNHLANLNNYAQGLVSNELVANSIEFKYEPIEKGFFTDSGKIFIKDKQSGLFTFVLVNVNKGFLNASIDFDLHKLLEKLIKQDSIINLDLSTVNCASSINYNAITSRGSLDIDFKGNYIDNTHPALDLKAEVDFNTDEEIKSKLKVSNLDLTNMASLGSISYESSFVGFSELKDFAYTKLSIEDFYTHGFSSRNADLELRAHNRHRNGNFDLNFKLTGDNLMDYITDFDFDVMIKSLSIPVFRKAAKGNLDSPMEILSTVKEIDVAKANATLGQIVGLFYGVRDLEKLPLESSGHVDLDTTVEPMKVDGEITVKTTGEAKGNPFFVNVGDEYRSVIRFDGKNLYVNNHSMF
jgi:hypothetical protein